MRTEQQVGPQLDKIQYLTDSLQLITRELNGVLGVLSSLNNHRSPLFTSTQVPSNGVPLSTYASLAGLQAGGSLVPPAGVSLVDQWVRSTGLSSSRSVTAGQTVDSILAEKWHKYFPGRSCNLNPSTCLLTTFDFSAANSNQLIVPVLIRPGQLVVLLGRVLMRSRMRTFQCNIWLTMLSCLQSRMLL